MPRHLRVARPAADLERTSLAYRRGLGLEVVGSFEDHQGFDGIMLGKPGAGYHLEFTRCRARPVLPTPTSEDLIVIYIPEEDEWRACCARMTEAGFREVVSHNPYWEARGKTYEDPDGYRVVLQREVWDNVVARDGAAPHASAEDVIHLRSVFARARRAAGSGNPPFGARLVGPDGSVLIEAGNRVESDHDATAHAEIVLIRQASATLDSATIRAATLYTSAEPCAMCAGAICWTGIGRIVYGIGSERVRRLDGPAAREPGFPGRDILRAAAYHPLVIGPVLEEEGAAILFEGQ